MRDEQSRFAEPPLLSLIVPVAQSSESMLEDLVQSLLAQVYERWELCLLGERPADEGVSDVPRSCVVPGRPLQVALSRVRGDSRTRGMAALRSAAGEFVVLVDPRLVLRPHALFLFARTSSCDPDTTLVYADEDVIDDEATRSGHNFKPDWNEALLCSQNYLGGLRRLSSLPRTGGGWLPRGAR